MSQSTEDSLVNADTLGVIFKEGEFILDFAKTIPKISRADGSKKVESIHTTIIARPEKTKRFAQLLQKNIEKYEEKHGEIEIPDKSEKNPDEDPAQDYIG